MTVSVMIVSVAQQIQIKLFPEIVAVEYQKLIHVKTARMVNILQHFVVVILIVIETLMEMVLLTALIAVQQI